jgi:AMMECR1 domain-containing protein
LKDRRFDPIRLHDVPYLRVAVSILVKYETCLHAHDWNVGVHGIIIRFSVGSVEYSATYLPEVAHEQGWTQEQAVRSLVKKAGYHGEVKEVEKKIYCTRYQSSKHRVTYQDYVNTIGADPLEDPRRPPSGSCISM